MPLNPGILGVGVGFEQGCWGRQGDLPGVAELIGWVTWGIKRPAGWSRMEEVKERLRTSAAGLAGNLSREGTQRAHGTGIPSRSGLSDFNSQSSYYSYHYYYHLRHQVYIELD